MTVSLACGFIPLVDCAPLVVAREMGFAAEEGIDLVLERQPTWSAARDKLALGRLEAAHMLSPVPVAMSLGIGGLPTELSALQVLSVNGNCIGVSHRLAKRLRETVGPTDILAAETVGRGLIEAADSVLRIGVPFAFSMHAELLFYWLGALGLVAPSELIVRTIPPPLMTEAIAAGEIDAFCVGEPWGSFAVEAGEAEIILASAAIWQFAPEKVLAVRRDFAEGETELVRRVMRAVWRAGRWSAMPENRMMLAELLGRPSYLDVSPEIIERALSGHIVVSKDGRTNTVPGFLEFFEGAATFPWRSQAGWIATRLARRMGLDREDALRTASKVFRPDLYRANLGSIGADLPGASEKLEGALARRTPVASSTGEMFLGPDQFFDCRVFDPMRPE